MGEIPAFTMDMAMVFGVIGVTVLLFLTEWLRVDVVAILVMITLPILGLIDGVEAFQGLASNAVVSIIAVIIIGRGLDHTGVVNRLVRPLLKVAGRSRSRITSLLCATVAVISSFMQNVGAAALLLPAIKRLSRKTRIPQEKLLMPVAFSAILGGTVTLVGSSPLIMLNDLLEPYGLEPFGLFSVTPIGVVLVGTGIVFFLAFNRFILPDKKEGDKADAARLNPIFYYPELENFYELEVVEQPDTQLKVLDLCSDCNAHTVALAPTGAADKLIPPDRDMTLNKGAVFVVIGNETSVRRLARLYGFKIRPELDLFREELSSDMSGVVEAVVPPHSSFAGQKIGDLRLRHNYRMAPLTLMHDQQVHYTHLNDHELSVGDTILMFGSWDSFSAMRNKRELLFVQSPEHEVLLPGKSRAALACFVLSLLLVIFSGLPLSVCLMAGAVGMVVTGVLDIDEAYRGVDWRTVFLLGGLIPLGVAMQKTQAASWMAAHLLSWLGDPPALVFLAVVGLLSTVITLVVSNVGATVLLVPLVVDMATGIGTDPRLAALVVGVAASNSFILPTHQVNALYMGPGRYKTIDYIRAGIPMSLLFLLVLTVVVGLLY